MGTTLTGTTPQDTYDSLIKVTDNGPLTGSLKKLTDGLGNDSSLSLSTTAASFSGTLAVSGNATFDTNTLFVDSANNRVGVGTITPVTALDINGEVSVAFNATYGARFYNQDKNNWSFIGNSVPTGGANANLRIGDSTGEVMRITGGNVGIGTNAPAVKLDVVGNIRSSTGILFGSDTAAANALDDYEEGTWTIGISFGGASAGVTADNFTGTYTKIGRQVTVNGYFVLTSKGSSTGSAKITGLPFTIVDGGSFYSVPSLWLDDITFANVYSGYGVVGDTKIDLYEFTEAGVVSPLTNADFADTSRIMLSFTYFV